MDSASGVLDLTFVVDLANQRHATININCDARDLLYARRLQAWVEKVGQIPLPTSETDFFLEFADPPDLTKDDGRPQNMDLMKGAAGPLDVL